MFWNKWPFSVAGESVFAKYVRQSVRRLNRNDSPHTERGIHITMPYTALEDSRAFHKLAEQCRLSMIERLREHGAPINVWRVGQLGGVVASPIDAVTGEGQPWKDEHQFYVRTRVSVEHPPFVNEG